MPVLNIVTNQAVPEADQPALLMALSETVADMLGKPEQYVMVSYQHNPSMLFAGQAAPLAYLELKSIGLPTDSTAALSARLCDTVHKHIGIARNRIYIEFSDAQRHLFGWDGHTFAEPAK